jgi:hypothetical protein
MPRRQHKQYQTLNSEFRTTKGRLPAPHFFLASFVIGRSRFLAPLSAATAAAYNHAFYACH